MWLFSQNPLNPECFSTYIFPPRSEDLPKGIGRGGIFLTTITNYMENLKSTELYAMFEIARLHAGSGNSTWIFEAAKNNPKCNIMYSHDRLAEKAKKKFEAWFIETYKRPPNNTETPHFFGIGGVFYHSKYGTKAPLIIDNSCFDMRYLEKYYDIIRCNIFINNEDSYRRVALQHQFVVNGIKNLILNTWFIPFKGKIIERINNLESKFKNIYSNAKQDSQILQSPDR